MNRTRGFDIAFVPQTPAAPSWRDDLEARLRGLASKSSERIGAFEPELSALVVIAPFVIAVLAALPTFIAA